jgi:hypothetical protein
MRRSWSRWTNEVFTRGLRATFRKDNRLPPPFYFFLRAQPPLAQQSTTMTNKSTHKRVDTQSLSS